MFFGNGNSYQKIADFPPKTIFCVNAALFFVYGEVMRETKGAKVDSSQLICDLLDCI